MSPEIVERIRRPYYTTREGGTGLGVVMARALVEQHGGELRYESAVGKGTTVSIDLPQCAMGIAKARKLPDPSRDPLVGHARPEQSDHLTAMPRVLAVDDDAAVRFTLEAVLTDGGLTVETADGGATALAAFDARGADIVVTDLAMPDIDGMKVLAQSERSIRAYR